MSHSLKSLAEIGDRQWFIVGRWREYAGEGRANLLRIAAIGAFYLIELVHHYGVLGAAERETNTPFHRTATVIALAWSLMAMAILYCLRAQVFPRALKYLSTTMDMALLTALALQTANPSGSPLVFVYFPLVVLAAVRFHLPLIWFATFAGMSGYMLLVGKADATWFDGLHATPIVSQLMMLVSLGATGVMLGQLVRQVRGLAEEYVERMTGVVSENS